jgi:PEGA domain
MRARVFLFVFGVLVVNAFGCQRGVHLSLTGPEELDGALVAVDGHTVAKFEKVASDEKINKELGGQTPRGAIAYVRVPKGAHELRVTKNGYKPIIRQINYEGNAGEDYIRLDAPEPAETPSS